MKNDFNLYLYPENKGELEVNVSEEIVHNDYLNTGLSHIHIYPSDDSNEVFLGFVDDGIHEANAGCYLTFGEIDYLIYLLQRAKTLLQEEKKEQ